MRRYNNISSPPLAALALLLLVCSFHCAAAARLLPTADGAKAAADGLVLQEGNGDEVSEMMGAAEEAACEDGNDDCMQRRLLHDAHLDYIYTQHKGKP